jgi:hypothetical protein
MVKVLTPEDGKEYERLYGEYRSAVNATHEALMRFGMESKAFAEADSKAGNLLNQMRKLRGEPKAHWMS